MSDKKRRNSYTADFKLKVIDAAEKATNRQAATDYSIDESSVRLWRKNKTVLMAGKRTKRARRHGKAHWPELENKLKQWVIENRREKQQVLISIDFYCQFLNILR